MTAPDPSKTITTPEGVEIPLGNGIPSSTGHSSLLYNEYPFNRRKKIFPDLILSLVFHTVFLLFENGFNEFLWCCSHMILKYVKKMKGAIDKNGTCKHSLTLCPTLRLP